MNTAGLPNAQLQWRASLSRYYKNGLDDFKDTTTVRHQLKACHEFLAQMEKLEEGISEGPNLDDWNKVFMDEKIAVAALIGDLQGWLAARNLTP